MTEEHATSIGLARELQKARDRIASLERELHEQARSRDFLAESLAHLQLLTDNVADVLWIMRLPELVFTYLSPSVERLTGYSKEEALLLNLPALFSGKDLETAQATLAEELAHDGEPGVDPARAKTIELEQFRKDGTTVPVEITTTISRDAKGQPQAILGVTRDITERKRTQTALMEHEKGYRELAENSPDGIVLASSEGRVIYANRRAAEITGYGTDELVGLDGFAELTRPEDRPSFADTMQKRMRGEPHPTTYERTIIRKDGSEVVTELTTTSTLWKGERVALASIRDISEQKLAAEREVRLVRMLRAIRSVNQLITKEKDKERLLERACELLIETRGYNGAWIALLDDSAAPVSVVEAGFGEHFRDMSRLLDDGVLPACCHRTLERQEIELTADTLVDCEGCPIASLFADNSGLTALLEHEGRVFGLLTLAIPKSHAKDEEEIAMIQDLARDLGQALQGIERDEALRVSDERLSSFIDSATDGFWLWDSEFRLVEINRASMKSMPPGIDKDDLIGKHVTEIFPNTKESGRYDLYRNIMKTGEPLFFDDLVPHHKFGNVNLSVKAFKVGDGLGIISADTTAHKKAEDEIRVLNEELDQRVRERTAELEAVNRELESFAYSVSHDLRSPLRGIDGFSQALLEDYNDKLDDQGKDYLIRVRNATQRMSGLIDDMLWLSRLTRSEMRYETVDLSALFLKLAAELRECEPDREAEIVVEPELSVRGDRGLLEAVLQNLLDNAWKFTARKEQARIELGIEELEQGKVCFVRDNGAGFDVAYADKLFGAFQRLHGTEEFPGTGIGLAIVQRAILRHGGRVWATGEVDKGAIFYFTLPEGSKGRKQK